ncbi:MAG TPA: helix-turn-helix domain-containing protein [Planctomycetota bacterium]|jgi:DNA-binding transcriptional ArsR family regulator|nr:helix-turn-helix domain-containing protein [Planctomycetota bacterium]
MRLLEYLVPSRARREVLKALRSRGGGLTAKRLAQETGVAYSSVHRELEQLKTLGLVKSERVGNATLCSWDAASPAARALEPLLHESRERRLADPSEETVLWNLRRRGAPLARKGVRGEDLSLESTLAYALRLARRRPEVARVWPVVFAKHRSELDLEALTRQSTRLGEKQALGFFVALTRRLLKDPSLAGRERALRDHRFKKTQDFFLSEESERARKLAELRTPETAREWHFRMNMPMESFESSFEKFVHA